MNASQQSSTLTLHLHVFKNVKISVTTVNFSKLKGRFCCFDLFYPLLHLLRVESWIDKHQKPIDKHHTLTVNACNRLQELKQNQRCMCVIVLVQHVSCICGQGVVHINLEGLAHSEHLTSALSSASAHRVDLLIKRAKRPGRVNYSEPKPII